MLSAWGPGAGASAGAGAGAGAGADRRDAFSQIEILQRLYINAAKSQSAKMRHDGPSHWLYES